MSVYESIELIRPNQEALCDAQRDGCLMELVRQGLLHIQQPIHTELVNVSCTALMNKIRLKNKSVT